MVAPGKLVEKKVGDEDRPWKLTSRKPAAGEDKMPAGHQLVVSKDPKPVVDLHAVVVDNKQPDRQQIVKAGGILNLDSSGNARKPNDSAIVGGDD